MLLMLELLGFAMIVAACAVVHYALGLLVGGAVLVFVANAIRAQDDEKDNY